jgi:thymidylate synthase
VAGLVYDPFDQRKPDSQYRDLLHRILEGGEKTPTRQGPYALTLMQQTMRFPLANGFPVITERSIASFWRKPIGELCAFINGATTLEDLREFGCDWWDAWATEEKTAKRGLPPGDIGPGSYGGAFHDFPTSEGPGFDQFRHLVEQIHELPADRTHFVSPWIPQYQVRGTGKTPRTTIAPCHGWVHVRILNDRLHLHMYQRSGDVPVGVPVEHGAVRRAHADARCNSPDTTGDVLPHDLRRPHLRGPDRVVRSLVEREPRRLPTVVLTEAGRAVSDIHDFRAEHFELTDYDPHPPARLRCRHDDLADRRGRRARRHRPRRRPALAPAG